MALFAAAWSRRGNGCRDRKLPNQSRRIRRLQAACLAEFAGLCVVAGLVTLALDATGEDRKQNGQDERPLARGSASMALNAPARPAHRQQQGECVARAGERQS
jgi:hypothetical protein